MNMTQANGDEPKTVRRRIAEALTEAPMTALELSQALRVSEKDITDHLPHIARSLAHGKKFDILPSRCLACGFRFKDRAKFTIPSRCPLCKSERIIPPAFSVR